MTELGRYRFQHCLSEDSTEVCRPYNVNCRKGYFKKKKIRGRKILTNQGVEEEEEEAQEEEET